MSRLRRPMEPLTPSAFDRIVNPSAYRRWREATTAGNAIRDCGCPTADPHEAHCDHWLRYTT